MAQNKLDQFHTPWSIAGHGRIYNSFNVEVAKAMDNELRNRIVACVNICAGISTEDLDEIIATADTTAARLAMLSMIAERQMMRITRG